MEQWNLSLGTLTWNSDLEPRNFIKPPHETSETYEIYLEPWNFLEPLLGTLDFLEPFETFTWNPYSEPRGTFTWNLRTSWNLYLELWNLLDPLLGTLTWNLATSWNLDLEPLEPSKSFAWNTYLEPWNLLDPWLGTLVWNLPEPLLGTPTWNLGTSRNLAGWLPQNAPGPSLAETPKFSAVGEKGSTVKAGVEQNMSCNGKQTKEYVVFHPEKKATKTVGKG